LFIYIAKINSMGFVNKNDVVHVLEQIATLLALKGGNQYKIRAYQNAARTVESVSGDLEKILETEKLPGIGKGIREKIMTLLHKGRLPYFEKLKKTVPPGLFDLLDIPGLGVKRVKRLYQKLHIRSIKDLKEACQKGEIAKLGGFGVRLQEGLLSGVDQVKAYKQRMLWWEAREAALPILESLKKLKMVKRVEIAGSFRRKLETVGDLDFLVSSQRPHAVIEAFTKQLEVKRVTVKGSSKASVRLKNGLQVDLCVIPEAQFGSALLYFTGSKPHNINLRKRALSLGLKLSEYGIGKKAATEKQIYRVLGLDYIPPELREDMGEIEAAEKHKLPKLIELKDIRGAFHCHTTQSDGCNTLEEMARAARNLGWEYLGIADHSKSSVQADGLDANRLLAQVAKIQKLNASKKLGIHLFAGVECDILPSGKLDFSNEILKQLDYVIVSIHRSFKMDEKRMTARLIRAIENPYTTMVGHITGRLLLQREPYAVNMEKVIDACIANNKIMELNASPMRLDMDWRLWKKAVQKGLKCVINPDAHSTLGLLHIEAGVNSARKGWLTKKDVINTKPLRKIELRS